MPDMAISELPEVVEASQLPQTPDIKLTDLLLMARGSQTMSVTGAVLEQWLLKVAQANGALGVHVSTTQPGDNIYHPVWIYPDGSGNNILRVWDEASQSYKGIESIKGDSVTVKSTAYSYAINDSGTTRPTSWSGTMPAPERGRYLWTRTTLTLNDKAATKVYLYSVAYQGLDGAAAVKLYQDVSVPVSAWAADSTYPMYGYRAAIPLVSAVDSMCPAVAFGAEAMDGTFAPWAQSYNGGVYIYSTCIPAGAIVIKSIKLVKEG